jgi:hypothetical protein
VTANKVLYWPKLFEGVMYPMGIRGAAGVFGDGPTGTTTGWSDYNGGDGCAPDGYGFGKGLWLSRKKLQSGPFYGGR